MHEAASAHLSDVAAVPPTGATTGSMATAVAVYRDSKSPN